MFNRNGFTLGDVSENSDNIAELRQIQENLEWYQYEKGYDGKPPAADGRDRNRP